MSEVARVYEGSARWARDVAQLAAPGAAYAHDLAVTADAVFARSGPQRLRLGAVTGP